jgi:hypothetical protein
VPVTVAVHDRLDGNFLLLDFDEAQYQLHRLPPGAVYIQDQDQVEPNFGRSESDSADAVVARIETLKTSSEA